MNAIANTFTAFEGDTVAGFYFGVPFSGRIQSARPHSMMWDCMQFFVELDKPITAVGRLIDDVVIVTVNAQGREKEVENTYLTKLERSA